MVNRGEVKGGSTGAAARQRGLVVVWLASALSACAMPVASAPSTASAITAITLERNCFGCSTGSMLVLRRDGTVRYTVTGNARHGTQDSSSVGTVGADDFDQLARLAVTGGFFELNDSYEDPELQDGAWTTTSVTRDGQEKRVFRRADAGPVTLKAVEQAIDALKARIKLAPEGR